MPERGWSRALVTGASSGIGRALAVALATRGVFVVCAARRAEELARVVDEITEVGGRARALVVDVGDTDHAVAAIRELDAGIGGLDLVVANAGVGPALDAPPHSWEAIAGPCHVNFCGAAATLTAVLPRMVERGRGHLVGIGSLSSFGALPGSAAYCSPKAGLAMLLECLRLDVAHAGVFVTSVHLGFVATPMVAHRSERMPLLMQPEELALELLDELMARPPSIAIPRPLAAAARAAAMMPRALRDRLLAKLR